MRRFLHPKHLHQFHARAVVSGLIHDPFVAGNLLESLLGLDPSALAPALALFSHAGARSPFMWNTLVHAHLANGLPTYALSLFAQMLRDPTSPPNRYSFPVALKALAQLQSFKEGVSLHSRILKLGFDSDPFVHATLVHLYGTCGHVREAHMVFDSISDPSVSAWTALLSGYAKLGQLEAAREVFDRMPERNLVSWNAMISVYVQGGRPRLALELFREMLVLKIRPNSSVMVSVLVAIAESGALREGRWIHAYLERSEVEWSPNLRTSLVNMYSKCGDVTSARQTFDRIRDRGVDLWNAMIAGLGLNGKGKEALELFDTMLSEGLKPDDMTFIGVLCGCSHAGLVNEGMACFEAMSQVHNVTPKVEHYSCMVDLLGRAGLLQEALELIRNMPVEANGRVWGSLFGACRIHGDVELGETVGKLLIESEPGTPGHYVLLASLYASQGRWKDAIDVRDTMKRRGVELEPGCSLTEVDGVVHEFLAGDRTHPRTTEIYDKLDEIAKLLRSRGYVPSTRHVSFDISEEEKEGVVFRHSEKLAIALCLISTGPEEVIRIVKNLRICGDCHSMAKVVSEAYSREIVIRDRSRFHHFRQGSCSCLDYW
ncbi:pentatricopeptide repeat-containing protein At5g48910-like [Phoenix dactylifera]|uniref:Pentatricopeptide repeat-containing protein At5g48910-like n=1 Tax=Phoenix dactylifera TaxID=42345 RepID=A0A8B7CVD7_PHODC|nr:pentatricopeptide repeat-containing protein At5g48910-like [Phoenix dactylifera]